MTDTHFNARGGVRMRAELLLVAITLLGGAYELLHPTIMWTETLIQETLPPRPNHTTVFFSSSPFYEQDHALFFSTVYPGTIWQSDDAGFTWSNLVDMSRYDGFRFGPVTVVPVGLNPGFPLYNDGTVISHFSLIARLLWYSDDNGATRQARIPSPGGARSDMYPTNDPNVMFALENWSPSWASWGIWRTDNGAQEWVEVWDSTNALDLAVSPDYLEDQTVFATMEDVSPELGSPVIISTDGGETWQSAGGEDLCNEGAGSIQISSGFTEDHALFVHQASSLFRSQDAGETWEVVLPRDRPSCQPGVLAPTADSYKLSTNFGQDHTLYMVRTGPNDDHRLLVSGDGGATWTFQSSLSRSTSLLWVLPAAENRIESETDDTANALFADAMAEGTSASSGLGAAAPKSNWTAFLPLIDWVAAQPTARPFTLFIKARNELDESTYYRSDDGGVTWACMLLPTVQPPARTQYLRNGR